MRLALELLAPHRRIGGGLLQAPHPGGEVVLQSPDETEAVADGTGVLDAGGDHRGLVGGVHAGLLGGEEPGAELGGAVVLLLAGVKASDLREQRPS